MKYAGTLSILPRGAVAPAHSCLLSLLNPPHTRYLPSDRHIRIVPSSPVLAWNNRGSVLHTCKGKGHTVIWLVYALAG
jgi:hypothetical protein